MNVNGTKYRTIWFEETNPHIINIIDQRFLPHRFVVEQLRTLDEVVAAIADMHVRGAGLIGAAAGCGMYLAALEAARTEAFDEALFEGSEKLLHSRPTAVNLSWAVKMQLDAIKKGESRDSKIAIAFETAKKIMEKDIRAGKRIGETGYSLIERIYALKNKQTVNILTHCNAGWLAFVDYGSALAPIYKAHDQGVDVHVWVDETRPRNQGAGLTAWELLNHGIKHTVIADNTGGHLMQHGMVDAVIVGADRITANGDTANKIGTYLKALAAKDNNIPFYVAAPSYTFDMCIDDGLTEIPIELRNEDEVKYVRGKYREEELEVLVTPPESKAVNYGFDVTPARLITAMITEKGICAAERDSIAKTIKG